jgi:hypothetical protein
MRYYWTFFIKHSGVAVQHTSKQVEGLNRALNWPGNRDTWIIVHTRPS